MGTLAGVRLKETMRDFAIEFRELPADRQENYHERMLAVWVRMMEMRSNFLHRRRLVCQWTRNSSPTSRNSADVMSLL